MLDKLQVYLQLIIDYLSSIGLIGGFFLIVLESVIPVLPLSVFVGLNILSFGNILGYVISYFGTIVGCMLSFIAFRYILRNLFYKIFKQKTRIKIENIMKKISNIDFNTFVIIIAIPFTPAFLINIIAGVSNLSRKKYLTALLIGKVSIVGFWGIIGKNFIESMTDIKALMFIALALFFAYIISKIVSRKAHIE